MRHYTKDQIAILGVRPRERKAPKYSLLPVEVKEVKAVVKEMQKDDYLFQYWRLIPFEEGYGCQLRNRFNEWIHDQVENMWYDIGRPEFVDEEHWHTPEGGFWPYLKGPDLGCSWMKVENAYIDMDEVYAFLRDNLEDIVRGYRMCPGMKLYRVVGEFLDAERALKGAAKAKTTKQALVKRMAELRLEMTELARDFPSATTREAADREYYGYRV